MLLKKIIGCCISLSFFYAHASWACMSAFDQSNLITLNYVTTDDVPEITQVDKIKVTLITSHIQTTIGSRSSTGLMLDLDKKVSASKALQLQGAWVTEDHSKVNCKAEPGVCSGSLAYRISHTYTLWFGIAPDFDGYAKMQTFNINVKDDFGTASITQEFIVDEKPIPRCM